MTHENTHFAETFSEPSKSRGGRPKGSKNRPKVDASSSIAAEQLLSVIERYERLEEERKSISDDMKDVLAEAGGNGFDVKIIRQLIRIRKQDVAERQEAEAILSLYMSAIGME